MTLENEDREAQAPADNSPITESSAVERLTKLFSNDPPKDTNRDKEPEAETADASEAVPDDGGEDAAPTDSEETEEEAEKDQEGDADKPQQSAKKGAIDLNAKIALEDGTEVTVNELRLGYYRQADYTRKTMEVAAERQNVQASYQRIQTEAQKLQADVDIVYEFARQNLPPEPDPRLLDRGGEYEFTVQQARRQAAEKQLQTIVQLKQQHDQKVQHEKQQAHEQAWAHTRKVLEDRMPDLKDPAKWSTFAQKADKALAPFGFSIHDMINTPDPRNFFVAQALIKAQETTESLKASLQKTKDLPPVQKPGKRTSSTTNNRVAFEEAQKRLSRTGRQEDAVAALMALDRTK